MEIVKSGRSLLFLPSRRSSITLLAPGFVGFVFAILTFKPGMMGLPLPISSLQLSSTAFSNRVSTILFPGSLDSHANPQQEEVRVPLSTHPGAQYRCMPHSQQLAHSLNSGDLESSERSNTDIEVLRQHHCVGIDDHSQNGVSSLSKPIDVNSPFGDDSSNNMSSSTKLKTSQSSTATDDRKPAHNMLASTSNNDKLTKCDLYEGKWVKDDMYPLYKPDSCPYVDKKFNCQQNGRPDTEYTRWRWAPRDCNLPRFMGRDMLESLTGKRLAFVGDSLNRNQWESMLCMLWESLADKSRVVHQQGSNRILKFLDYNCTVEFYKSRYLVDMKEGSDETNFKIRLDTMDKFERKWRNANVLVFNTGHWWGPGKLGKGENRFQEGQEVHDRLDVTVAYKKALSTWGQWVDTHVDPHGTRVFFRTFSPQHFRGGQWNAGGHCEDETEPIHDESYIATYPNEMRALEEVVGSMKVHVHVLNVTNLSAFRKDAHPSVYWHPQNLALKQQDCGHWCLPGLPDTWNELLYAALTNDLPIST